MPEFARNEKIERQLQDLSDALKAGRLQPVRQMINDLPASEMADLLESLPPNPRALVWELVDPASDGEILVHVNDEVRASLIDAMDNQDLVQATSELDLDDLADILDDLPEQVIQQVTHAMDREDRERLNRVLSYPEDSAGGLMDPDVITVRANVTLEVVLRYLRMLGELPETIDSLTVIDRDGHYYGKLALTDVLIRDPAQLVSSFTDVSLPAIDVNLSDSEVAAMFEHNDWVSAPVVDEDGSVLGRITIDDIVDVIRDEAEHTVMSMAGLDEEDDMFAPVIASSRRRSVFLGINLVGAFAAALVIGLFDQTIEQVVALAILMPVVATMGGMAGTQTFTLVVRGMATGQVGSGNTAALLSKELAVGGINGLFWAAVVATIAFAWFRSAELGAVAAMAIVINLLAGALIGVLVPLGLRRISVDPALAGGFVMTLCDVIGFTAFLGLGTLFLM
jgi:magnesium transporter